MRIGLFTDSYRPSTNGIVTVIDTTKQHLEELGHEVFVLCPANNFIKDNSLEEDDHVIRLPAVKGVFFDDYRTSVFFPPRILSRIKKLKLDVIHFFTPGQIGLLAVYAGRKTGAVTVAQHSTDVYEYIDHYPMAVPGVFLLASAIPMTIKLDAGQRKRFAAMYRPTIKGKWSRNMIEGAVTLIYGGCDAAVVLSRKSLKQIKSWKGGDKVNLQLIPTGIDAIPPASEKEIAEFRKRWNISPKAELVTYIGRLGSEKNLDILIPTIERVLLKRPNAHLLFVGDFEYREHLEASAFMSSAYDRITFTGMLPRDTLGSAYGASDVFVFPSVTDTQGLVLHEAAHAGLPIVAIDREVTEVVRHGQNGFIARDSARDLSLKIVTILSDDELKAKFSKVSKELAMQYGARHQVEVLVKLYEDLLKK